MSQPLEYSSYPFNGHDEFCLRAGSHHQKTILFIPPLFDEMNRVRRMIVGTMRLLNEHAIGSILPDLPGTNESLFPLEQASLTIWRNALAHCAEPLAKQLYVASFRGGCLIDDFAVESRKWRLAPAKGPGLLRTMMRTRMASDKEAGLATDMTQLAEEAQRGHVNLAGNHIGPKMFAELQDTVPMSSGSIRTAQLTNSNQAADVKLSGSALWLRAEPDDDPQLAKAIADDLLSWVAQ
ncbi:MAG: hypothetical protein V7676_05125 [Parasphingorhabdus sp.]|uniref:hypothetical protein n=1 Tax=Parasphingorhabdus sp. TaxID=2709688 RepID=UPI0030020FDF